MDGQFKFIWKQDSLRDYRNIIILSKLLLSSKAIWWLTALNTRGRAQSRLSGAGHWVKRYMAGLTDETRPEKFSYL